MTYQFLETNGLTKTYYTVGQLNNANGKDRITSLNLDSAELLSKWLYTDADVLILDEPTRGIDVGAKYEIYTLINDMVAQGKAVVVISSELEELQGITDRIYTLAYGRITGELPTASATQEELMRLMTIEPKKEKAS